MVSEKGRYCPHLGVIDVSGHGPAATRRIIAGNAKAGRPKDTPDRPALRRTPIGLTVWSSGHGHQPRPSNRGLIGRRCSRRGITCSHRLCLSSGALVHPDYIPWVFSCQPWKMARPNPPQRGNKRCLPTHLCPHALRPHIPVGTTAAPCYDGLCKHKPCVSFGAAFAINRSPGHQPVLSAEIGLAVTQLTDAIISTRRRIWPPRPTATNAAPCHWTPPQPCAHWS